MGADRDLAEGAGADTALKDGPPRDGGGSRAIPGTALPAEVEVDDLERVVPFGPSFGPLRDGLPELPDLRLEALGAERLRSEERAPGQPLHVRDPAEGGVLRLVR